MPETIFPAPFIVGCGRSGTALLRLMLDAHPDLSIPPETGFIPAVIKIRFHWGDRRRAFYQTVTDFHTWDNFNLSKEELYRGLLCREPFTIPDGLRSFYRAYANRFGKKRWGDKTPSYGLHLAKIQKLLPEARFIHVIRDGRDVALSMRELWWAPGGKMTQLARYWADQVRRTRAEGRRVLHYFEVRYEDLVRNTRAELERICAYLDLPFSGKTEKYYENASRYEEEVNTLRDAQGRVLITREELLSRARFLRRPPDISRISRWKTEMKPGERLEFEAAAGDLLRQLGYE
ncbi:MAG: sulfotransferase family protein [Candidatus Omnitrophota bacterium]